MASAVAQAFGPRLQISAAQIFFRSALSFAFVNISPVVAGHVLVAPTRVVPTFAELRAEEVADLFGAAQLVARALPRVFGDAPGLTLALQDGPVAGQTVPHVHVHLLPRRPGDFGRNDEVYERLDDTLPRPRRSEAEMGAEAAELAAAIAALRGNADDAT